MKNMFKYYRNIFSQEFIDRTISGGIKGQITLLIAVIVGVLLIASIIVSLLHIGLDSNKEWCEQIWILYNNFVDSGNQFSQKEWGNRILVSIISLLGSILLGGVLISTISNIIERRVDTIRNGKAYYKSINNHYVIIGYNNITISLIKNLYKEEPNASILIMSSKNSENIRHALQAHLDQNEENNIYIYFGNIESLEELKKLNIDKAKEVYIMGEDNDYGRDSKNIKCVHNISLLKGKVEEGYELPVYTLFEHLASYSIIQRLDIMNNSQNEASQTKRANNIYFRPFNLYENWARRLWSFYALEDNLLYDPLDYEPICFLPDGSIKNHDKYVHLVIVGFCEMGQAILLEALRVCHYANYDDSIESKSRIRTKITIIDKNIEHLREHFTAEFPNLDNQINDIQITFRDEDVCSPSVRKDLTLWAEDPQQLLTIVICVSDSDESIKLGLNLPGEIYQSETRVLIRQEIQTDLGQIIHKDNKCYRNVKIFGMLEHGVSKNMLQDEIPSYINQEYDDFYNKGCTQQFIKNLYQCMITNKTTEFKQEKSRARKNWINLEENMRWANRYQIDTYLVYLKTLGYKIARSLNENQKEISPTVYNEKLSDNKLQILMRMEKYRWNAERTIEGWKYGKVRNNNYRIHHLIIPFSQVPEKEKLKDRQVIDNLPYLISLAGYKLYK